MSGNFQKIRYILSKGCTLSHTSGMSAENSTLSYSHYTKDCIFYYFLKGKGNIKIEGRTYEIEEGDIILINPTELYRCEIYPGYFHERLVLRVNHSILDNFLQDGSSLLSPLYERKKGSDNYISSDKAEGLGLKKFMEDIFLCAKSEETSEHILGICKTVELISLISKFVIHIEKNTDNVQDNPIINNVLLYIDSHFRDNLTIEGIANIFHIEKTYLSHLFKEYVGISLWSYVIFKRINYFNDLLFENFSIEEAYISAGFQNYSNFFRLYKKYMEMTPSEFKKAIKV